MIEIKQVEQSDLIELSELVFSLLDELADQGQSHSRQGIQMTASKLFEAGAIVGLIARNDITPVGLLMLNECAAVYAGGYFGEITELYVDPEYRSSGVARELLTEAETLGKARGWQRLEVGAPPQPKWSRSLQFYLKEGFEETGPRLRKKIS